jgi:hypothetical protein
MTARFHAVLPALLLAVGACDTATAPAPDASLLAVEGAPAHVVLETPFQARAYTDLAGLAPDPLCGDPPRFLNTQVGAGEATHLGRFTVHITFCVDATDLLDDGMLTEGESVPYDNGFGVLVAANGDELYMAIAGAVLPSDDPAFDFEFHDPFTFVGGTGRFEGATGEGMTDSFVDQAADRTYHDWSGVLRHVR